VKKNTKIVYAIISNEWYSTFHSCAVVIMEKMIKYNIRIVILNIDA